jgi:hypothetical protein
MEPETTHQKKTLIMRFAIRVCQLVNGCRRRVQRICGGSASMCELHELYDV